MMQIDIELFPPKDTEVSRYEGIIITLQQFIKLGYFVINFKGV